MKIKELKDTSEWITAPQVSWKYSVPHTWPSGHTLTGGKKMTDRDGI